MPNQLQIQLIRFFPILLLVINLILKSLYLTSQDIGLDEPFTIYHSQFSFSTIIEQLKNYNNPPLYELLLHFWIKLFGISPTAVRILPFIFASLSPVALYYFAKRHFSLLTAVTSSLLLSFSSLLNYYAHDCRVYSLFLLLGILSMQFFLILVQQERKKITTLSLFIVCSSFLVYAHYFGILILAFQGIYLLIYYRSQFLKFIIYYLVVLIAYLPHLYVLFGRLGVSVKNGTWLKPPSGVESLYNMLWAFSNYPFVTVICIVILLCGLIAGFKNVRSIKTKPVLLILIWFLLPFFGMFFISYWVPMYISRYLVFVLPAYYMLLVHSILAFSKVVWARNSILTGIILCFAFTTDLNPDKKQKIHETIAVVKEMKDPATLLIVTPFDFLPSFAYHYNRKFFASVEDEKEYHLMDSLLKNDNAFVVNSFDDLLFKDLSNYNKLIYIGVGKNLAPQKEWMGFKLTEEKRMNEKYYIRIFIK